MWCGVAEPVKYQLRAYIYQARGLWAADDTGLSGRSESAVRVSSVVSGGLTFGCLCLFSLNGV